ncbi:unnamed protein product, partial [Rotaria sordida]
AVRARFRISESHWHEFFTLCLRRTLTQMLCDVRRQYIRDLQQQNQAQQQPILPAVHANIDGVQLNHQYADDSLIEDDE